MYSYSRLASEQEIQVKGKTTHSPYTVYFNEDVKCWTWRNSRGYGQSLAYLNNRHKTSEDAIEKLQEVDDPILAAQGTRAEYEKECRKLNAECLPDKEVDSYAVRYGDFNYPHYKVPQIMSMSLARRRLKALEKEPKQAKPEISNTHNQPWGSGGVRYDEACDRCHRTTEVDNNSGLCRHCSA
jgi:hypothetical protein